MVRQRKILVIFFVFFLIFLTQTKVLAAEFTIPNTLINPNNYLIYSMKRLFEKTLLYTKLTKDSKANYYRDLAVTRIAELNAVVNQNLLSEVQQSTQRLSYEIGTLSDFVSANEKDLSKKKQGIIEFLSSLKGPLATLRDKYPANSAYWLLIQDNINSIDLNLEKLK